MQGEALIKGISPPRIFQINKEYVLISLAISSHSLRTPTTQYGNYADILYSLTATFTKISIILLVLRLFCLLTRDRFYWMLQGLNVLNTSYHLCYLVIPIMTCSPREKIWRPQRPGKCLNIYVLYISSATFNTLSDMAMFFFPLWKIWNLSISRSRKLGVSAIFFSGAL